MNGRLAYQLMGAEKYLTYKYPDKDFAPLFRLFWQSTNGMFWDTFSDYAMDLEPSNMTEFKTYKEQIWLILKEKEYNLYMPVISGLGSEVDDLFETLKEQTFVYAYTCVPVPGEESVDIVFDTIAFLEKENIPLPDINLVKFTAISQRDGWGDDFDGTKLSVILSK